MNTRTVHTVLIFYSRSINDRTLTEKYLNRIRLSAPQAKIIISNEVGREHVKENALTVDVAFGKVNGDWVKDLPNLRWIQLSSAGANRLLLDHPEIKQRDLIITNSSGVHEIPISEHILALMLTLSRDIQRSIRRQIKHNWANNKAHRANMSELSGTTIGLIGVGKIGQMTARKAKAMGMNVLGLRRKSKLAVNDVDKMYGPNGLPELLADSDWVVITAPLTSETKGMIGEAEFKSMKNSAYIINISRGPIIQGKALIKALQKGWIAGAGLDVFEREPLYEKSPLWDMENVVITTHDAGASSFHIDRCFDIFTENLKRYRAGKPLMNLVDKNLGY